MRAAPQGSGDDGQEAPQSFKYEKEWALLPSWAKISIGVASMVPHPNNTAAQLLHCADQALYQAKQAGRARFVVANSMLDRPSATATSQPDYNAV